jgi:hypothetical protein
LKCDWGVGWEKAAGKLRKFLVFGIKCRRHLHVLHAEIN